MIQLRSSPYQGVPLYGGLGQLVPRPPAPYQQADPAPAPVSTGGGAVSPAAPGDPSFSSTTEWYKRPSVIIGGIAGIVVLGALGWWAFK